MKFILVVIVFSLALVQGLQAHEVVYEEEYSPNAEFIACKQQRLETECMVEHPIWYSQVIPSKYLDVYVESDSALCFDLSRKLAGQPKVQLHTILGKTATYTFGLDDDMSAEELKKVRRTLAIHIHRNDQTQLCANGNGFLFETGAEFINIWKSAAKEDQYPFFGRDIWISYKHGDWKKFYQFWK